MIKRIILATSLLILIVLLIEVFNVLQLKRNVGRYADFWHNYNTRSSGEFTYVALGDSAAQGLGASNPQKGYVGLLASHIEASTHKKVRLINLSVSGARIEDVLNKQLPELAKYKPDLVTVEIGANDVASGYNAAVFSERFNNLAEKLPAGTVVSNMPYFGGRIRHNAEALSAGTIIKQATTNHDLVFADLQAITRTHNSVLNYASDYFHPSNTGYKNWEAAFWQAVEPRLNDAK